MSSGAGCRNLIDDVDLLATEDRDQTYVYAIRIWRAAGFIEGSRLFPVSDERVLRSPRQWLQVLPNDLAKSSPRPDRML